MKKTISAGLVVAAVLAITMQAWPGRAIDSSYVGDYGEYVFKGTVSWVAGGDFSGYGTIVKRLGTASAPKNGTFSLHGSSVCQPTNGPSACTHGLDVGRGSITLTSGDASFRFSIVAIYVKKLKLIEYQGLLFDTKEREVCISVGYFQLTGAGPSFPATGNGVHDW